MKPLSDSDRRYISEQIDQFNDLTKLSRRSSAKAYEKARKGCLWRIASRANLFEVPLVSRQLTDTQWNEVIDFIEQFQGGQQG